MHTDVRVYTTAQIRIFEIAYREEALEVSKKFIPAVKAASMCRGLMTNAWRAYESKAQVE